MVVEIEGITLLSKEEYLAAEDVIPLYDIDWWWLRSPGKCPSKSTRFAAVVFRDGSVYSGGRIVKSIGNYVGFSLNVVRPAILANLKSLHRGDKIEFAGHRWTVISENMMFIDDDIGKCAFNENYKDGNDYNNSTVKEYCERGLASHRYEPMYLLKEERREI